MFLFVYRFAAIFTMIVWVIAYLNVAPYSAPDGEAVCRPASEASKPCSRCSLTSVARAAPRGARRAQASPPYVGPGVEAFKISGAGSAPTPIVKRHAFAYFAVIAFVPRRAQALASCSQRLALRSSRTTPSLGWSSQ